MKGSVMEIFFTTKVCFAAFCFICITCLVANSAAITCDSCGRECASACGTKHFRTCCFNYLRKRSAPPQSFSSKVDYESNGIVSNPFAVEQSIGSNSNIFEHILEDVLQHTKDMESSIQQAINSKKLELAGDKRHRMNTEIDYP